MKKIFIFSLSLLLLFLASISAYADGAGPRSVDAVLNDIRAEQGIQPDAKINPDLVSQDRLEELGDAVMEAAIGNTSMHDRMDQRLGGDGSASLTAVHVQIGSDYLNGKPIRIMSYMGGIRMGSGTLVKGMPQGGMMGYNNRFSTGFGMAGFGWIAFGAGALLIALVAVLGVVAVKALWCKLS